MSTYSIQKGYGSFQWFVVQDSTGEKISEHASHNEAEMAKFEKECEF